MNLPWVVSDSVVIDYYENQNEEKHFYFLRIRLKKNEYEILESRYSNSFEKIKTFTKKSQGVLLNINSSAVLTKIVPWSANHESMIRDAFPNVDMENFYFQIGKLNDKGIIALARTSHIKNILQTFESKGFKIKHISIGISMIDAIIPHLVVKNFSTAKYQIKTDPVIIDEHPLDLQNAPGYKIEVSDFNIESYYLPGFSSFLSYVQGKSGFQQSLQKQNEELKSNYRKDLFFKTFLISSIAIIFIALLINSYLYTNYYQDLNYYKSLSNKVKTEKIKWNQLKEEHSEKKDLVDNFYSSIHSKTTFFLNQIIVSIPDSMILTQLTFQPVEKTIENDYPIEIEKNVILIKGETPGEYIFSQWIKTLEEKNWVNSVEMNNYQSAKNDRGNLFDIKLIINDQK